MFKNSRRLRHGDRETRGKEKILLHMPVIPGRAKAMNRNPVMPACHGEVRRALGGSEEIKVGGKYHF
jgi:hypothetical protein